MLPLLLSSFLLLHHVVVDADCEQAACGNLTVKYPFWLGAPKRPMPEPSCGHPAFQLWCSGHGSTFTASMRSSAIQVLSIDYGSNSFVASDTRLTGAGAGADAVCRADFNVSSSLALSPFRISPSSRAIYFLHDCNGTEPIGAGFVNATARCGKPTYACLGGVYDRDTLEPIPASCTFSYLPALASEAAAPGDYTRLLKAGFQLQWAGVGFGDCAACGASGGQCRYSNATAAFGCLCPGDGELRGSTCDELGELIEERSSNTISEHVANQKEVSAELAAF
ncbi:hypothetical protein ZWY2020_031618 [Hordeum vulgare]|nr:hypothetical protein ZWY2020_031618 [Hordeum vulgare]